MGISYDNAARSLTKNTEMVELNQKRVVKGKPRIYPIALLDRMPPSAKWYSPTLKECD